MANEQQKQPYQPYSHDSEGTLVENNGQNATQPFRPNGWGEKIDESTAKEKQS